MARLGLSFATLALCCIQALALPYLEEFAEWNLNTAQGETDPTKYWGEWEDHDFQPSPSNWRFPFYTLFLDRYVNGNPSNDNINGTVFEVDHTSNQLRYGGDIEGLIDTLDYIHGMGIKGLYIAGSPFLNLPWAADSYSPTDLTVLDWHFGNITMWRKAITEIHDRGMYVILDNTMSTMSDLIGYEGYLNTTAPFKWDEHKAVWKSTRRYWDFDVSNDVTEDCAWPKFWSKDATMVGSNVTDNFVKCRKSEFDLFGDVESFGTYPEYQKQLSKFSFVQDRLKEWEPATLTKLKLFSCIAINMLDFDGFRIDKQLTITLEAQAEWSQSIRECAAKVGKKNFLISGEIVSDNTLGSIYLGRGKEPQMKWATNEEAFTANSSWPTAPAVYQRNSSAVDAWAFHYSVYRSLLRYLGVDGIYEAERDIPVDWVDAWNEMVKTNDLVNPNTGEFDPRHLYGATNQDVFRWPGITNGTDRNLAGLFVTTLIMPGIPLLFFGEEQAYYVLESTADNYIFGRQPLSSSLAWQDHGCYQIPFTKYTNFPLDKSLRGCTDDTVSYDHRDPSHPVRNIIKRMYELRTAFPTLNDGFELQKLSNLTYWNYLPGSAGTGTEMGLRSVVRMRNEASQDFSDSGAGNQPVWLVYTNDNTTTTYSFDCSDKNRSLIAPFDSGTTVKNLFYPYEEYTLKSSPLKLGLEDQTGSNGCLDSIDMKQWGFKALVPVDAFADPNPVITKFVPGHDYRHKATSAKEEIDIEIHFSHEMSCDSLTKAISFTSNSADGSSPSIDTGSVNCTTMSNTTDWDYNGAIPSAWKYSATLKDVAHGVHRITLTNATTTSGLKTGSKDHFMIRVGEENNPITFPRTAKFSTSLVTGSTDSLVVKHNAAGATKFRASRDWGSSWTDWLDYTGDDYTMPALNWTGTKDQSWTGEHVIVQYWGSLVASSAHQQEGDLDSSQVRAFPHLFVNGPYNQYGYDGGLKNTAKVNESGHWHFDLATEWPAKIQFNVWGMNPDGKPDQSYIFGDIDGDGILDRLPPSSLTSNTVNISSLPASPYTAYKLAVSYDGRSLTLMPTGHMGYQLTLFILLWIVPVLTAAAVIFSYTKAFYQVKFNTNGVTQAAKQSIPLALRRRMKRKAEYEKAAMDSTPNLQVTTAPGSPEVSALAAAAGAGKRRAVLIATMEYDIEDWGIKIKIGGLGVMAQLMGKSLGHQDLIWVVPCVGGVDYPVDEVAEPMYITIMDKVYQINVGIHKLRNITYVLLDAPVFRQQTKSEPYPPRMDDLDSGIYYSAWNQCIAETVKRFPQIDLYHINDYHGALAPLYLLPNLIPCALSLHNAEFQGLWPMRTHTQIKEVCSVFNLDDEIAKRYVQFGEVFNLLHAAASYLRIHQKGFGAVGVSRKYGKRSFARYPIFWGLPQIGSLPNPDPTDTAEWDRNEKLLEDVPVDPAYEASRGELKRQAQEWAGLNQDPEAELFVFVGRWSMQKGVDLIADVFPSILKNYPKVQLIAIGPVIDLYGRFAAIKLQKIMELFPGRVYSKPEFTALPPFIFSGAEFALIPSRDEPFGLVAVEFGRKGALGVGARVGGLGQMPGWWFTVESMTPKHLIRQFKSAMHDALASDTETRAKMRARSAKQRFPVAQWVEDLETLQTTCIKINHEQGGKHKGLGLSSPSMLSLFSKSPKLSPNASQLSFGMGTPTGSRPVSAAHLSVPPHSPGQPSPRPDDIYTPGFHSPASSPGQNDVLLPPPPLLGANLGGGPDRGSVASFNTAFSNSSVLSLDTVVGSRHDMALQKVDPSFTDANGYFSREFEQKLEKLNPSTSENQLCIEDILVKSEKKWFNTYRDAKLGKTLDDSSMLSLGLPNTRPSSPAPSGMRSASGRDSPFGGRDTMTEGDDNSYSSYDDMHPLGAGYDTPTGIKKLMMMKIGEWPVYSLFLALGQIIAANSYQVSLLSGEVGQSATTLYIIATIYAVSSVLWWYGYRRLKSYYVLSIPFLFYGAAFFCVGIAPFATSSIGKTWAQRVGSGLYSVASASGSIYFALNFGEEGGAPIKTWVLRACLVQGTQQIYISALWYWGSALTQLSDSGVETQTATPTAVISGVCIPLAFVLWAVGTIIYLGLPNYYRQIPGDVPSFYRSLYQRKIIMWFFVTVFVQNYWLAAPYGRNWRFLWTTNHASGWQILLLVIFFFIFVWAAAFWFFGRLSKSHSWILPMFAIGVGAPRWAQMLWGVSGIANYMPWVGSQTASALIARALWLWLGVLDALQGVGFGMMLLQTMTRFHNTFSLIAAQFIGSVATIIGRATAPDRLGPGSVFPNFAIVGSSGLNSASFWICLLMQLGICVGFATFFRKEQLMKP
ncbi:Cell wall alpha-1,3-glucan synthase ags1 [Diplodia seriata]|uniref:alpha-1,3-glucan synthase n=1 Tax=Diplodia seriata TaxID=420778 RepID=A0A0G2E5Y1_9PEZI|nr:putative alpha-glucan synthase [Diplodia seriata]OMP86673.1 Cell wall alpha-1,3-glucan synthase mok13 [Diplodia seriata]